MALGGGLWYTQNKILPGAYIAFYSAAKASATLSDRGYVALGLELDWGPDDIIFPVTSGDLQTNSMKIFGYDYTNSKLKGLRDLFLNAKTGYLYKLNTGGARASNAFGTARYKGERGNDIKIVIAKNENWVASTNEIYDVSTYLGIVLVDEQMAVAGPTASALQDNDWVNWTDSAPLAVTAGTVMTGGTDGTVTNASHQEFLDQAESYSFNILGAVTNDSTLKGLYAAYTARMRDEVGKKFQCVLFQYTSPDYEGVISVENGIVGALTDPSAVYWASGAAAGCAVNKSNTNKAYTGEYDLNVAYTQVELEAALQAGKFIFHKVNDQIRVLEDINTFVSVTDDKSADFSSNQTIRVLDQIGNDIAVLFNDKYLGKVPNDAAGRISLWNDIVKHHEQMQTIRAIENFTGEDVTVEAGATKKAVVVTDYVTPVNCMAQLYMTVIVE